MNITIRETQHSDLTEIMRVEEEAFGSNIEAELVQNLLNDQTAEPRLSLLAFDGNSAVGHILFTAITIGESTVKASILAPLAVTPEAQKQGIGGKLIKAGLAQLKAQSVSIVLVLGHPEYYTRYGFSPVYPHPINAPYPIPEEHRDAWMMHVLDDTDLSSVAGTVTVSDELGKPEYWQE